MHVTNLRKTQLRGEYGADEGLSAGSGVDYEAIRAVAIDVDHNKGLTVTDFNAGDVGSFLRLRRGQDRQAEAGGEQADLAWNAMAQHGAPFGCSRPERRSTSDASIPSRRLRGWSGHSHFKGRLLTTVVRGERIKNVAGSGASFVQGIPGG